MDDAHWSEDEGGGVKVKGRFMCTENGVDQIQATVILFRCPERSHEDEAGWESVDRCIQVDARQHDVNSPQANVWYDRNYKAMAHQPIIDGWYAGCVIAHYVQFNGPYRSSPDFSNSFHPAHCTQASMYCTEGEPYET